MTYKKIQWDEIWEAIEKSKEIVIVTEREKEILNEYDKLYCDYKELEQEKDKQKELIDKIIKHCEEEIIAINCGHIETRSLRGQLKNILDLIKGYEDE